MPGRFFEESVMLLSVCRQFPVIAGFSAALVMSVLPLHAAGLEAGLVAPAFRLQDQTGAWRQSQEFRGRWLVLYFYPKDDTPSCTAQACEFRDNIFAFQKAGATVLGISVDDVASHKQFAEENNLPFALLADSNKETAKSYGVLKRFLGVMEVASRETFLIDPQGRIAKHYGAVDPKGHSLAVLADLRALQAKSR
jgi:peroxiredoxin Q/BCP